MKWKGLYRNSEDFYRKFFSDFYPVISASIHAIFKIPRYNYNRIYYEKGRFKMVGMAGVAVVFFMGLASAIVATAAVGVYGIYKLLMAP